MDIQRFYDDEFKHYTKKNKNTTKITVTSSVISAITTATTIVGGVTALSFVGIPIGAAVSVSFGSLGLLSGLVNYVYGKKKRRYVRILEQIERARLDFKYLLQEANLDGVIDEREFKKLTQTYKFYQQHKEEIKKGTKFTVEEMFEKVNVNLGDDVKKAILEALNSKNE